ncbi:MAG: SulP family inorganic anion transporter, partial [Cyclobacteriaceae bacterium]
ELIHIMLAEEVSFLNKGALIKALQRVPDNKKVIIDGTRSTVIDYDVIEVIEDFKIGAKERNIELETINIALKKEKNLS